MFSVHIDLAPSPVGYLNPSGIVVGAALWAVSDWAGFVLHVGSSLFADSPMDRPAYRSMLLLGAYYLPYRATPPTATGTPYHANPFY